MPLRPALASTVAAAVLALAGCAATQQQASPELYQAHLQGAQEVPAVPSPGSGEARVEVDANGTLRWTLSHEGLSGPVTAAHIHGPAGPGQNAPPLLLLNVEARAPSSQGQLRISPEQRTQLESGQWYVNLHTARHPAGEIRGQLRPHR